MTTGLTIGTGSGTEDFRLATSLALTRSVEDDVATARFLIATATPFPHTAMMVDGLARPTSSSVGTFSVAKELTGHHAIELNNSLHDPMTVRSFLGGRQEARESEPQGDEAPEPEESGESPNSLMRFHDFRWLMVVIQAAPSFPMTVAPSGPTCKNAKGPQEGTLFPERRPFARRQSPPCEGRQRQKKRHSAIGVPLFEMEE